MPDNDTLWIPVSRQFYHQMKDQWIGPVFLKLGRSDDNNTVEMLMRVPDLEQAELKDYPQVILPGQVT